MVILIVEEHGGTPVRASLEALTAARQLDPSVAMVLLGSTTAAAAESASHLPVDEVIALEHPSLATYSAEGTVSAVAALVRERTAAYVVSAHTYRSRDYMPRLAARLDRPLVSDCTRITKSADRVTFTRPIFQGKVVADVEVGGPPPVLVTTQIGAFDAAAPDLASRAPVNVMAPSVPTAGVRQSAEPPFREARQDVDLTKATRIVAAGRGVKEEAQLGLVRELASALGAEVAASRPLCDAGWVPMDRQIGSSGQTVSPQLYVALGISGAIQHVVGMKGSKTIVAINKDADAPIFEVADYGIVGDLFDVVPALIAALEAP